jgi:hypothetical protein
MAKTAIPLQDLAERISQQQAALEKLRREYQARQTHLRELTRRKEHLQAQLRQVEADIRGLDKGVPPTTKPAAKPGKKPAGGGALAQFVVEVVTAAGRPVTAGELAAEVVRRKVLASGPNVAGLVGTQVYHLVRKGILKRAKDQAGVLPAQPPPARTAPVAKPRGATARPPAAAEGATSLAAEVTKILARSGRPLSARALAEAVLASGYQTKSKDFPNVISACVGKMGSVEHVPGQGYRLKKAKGAK